MDKNEDFNVIGGNDYIKENFRIDDYQKINDDNQQDILKRNQISQNLEKNEPIKRNDINLPKKYYKKKINKNNINKKCINKKKRNFKTHQNKDFEKVESKINKYTNIIGDKIKINKKINNEVNVNEINKNKINVEEMRNKPKLPELSDDINSNIIKNEKIFAETTNNFFSKKINFNDKELENKNQNIFQKINDVDSNEINDEKIFNQSSENNFLKNKKINNDNSIIENKIINSNENNIDNKINKSIENRIETKNKSNKIKKIRPNLSTKILNNKENKEEPKIGESIEPIKHNNKILKEENNINNINNKDEYLHIEFNNKINELNDDIYNLNINEIIGQKNEINSNKAIEINKDNKKPNIINSKNSNDKNDEPYTLKKISSLPNYEIKEKMISAPKYFRIYEKINIFNSILIMLNNNSIINNYFQKDRKQQIIQCEKKNKYCISSILYYLYKYLWYINNTSDIPQKNLIKKYNDFIDIYSETNYKNSNSTKENYCYEIKNIEKIIEFIYNKINREFSDINEKIKMRYNPGNLLSKFVYEFSQNNNSFISDHFIGFYQKFTRCQMCQRKYFFYNMNYSDKYEFFPFYSINFDLKEVIQFYNNNNFQINDNPIINLDNCFYFALKQKFKTNGILCSSCLTNCKTQLFSLYSLPNILTIILSNNENCIFNIQDEIDLSKYSPQSSGKKKYLLISILCQIKNKDFILYNLNHKDSLWYSYSNGRITKVIEMNREAMPLVLVYQSIDIIKFKYNKLRIEEIIKLNVKFMNGIEPKDISFPKYTLIKYIIKKIAVEFKLNINKIKIVINGKRPNDYELLSKVINNVNNNILVYLSE